MRNSILIYLFALFYNSFAHANYCMNDDVLIAGCQINGKDFKEAYICSAKNGKTGYYFFKKDKKIEMSVQFNKNKKLQRWLDKGTYTTYFGFLNGDYAYIIGVPEENFDAKAFLNVKKNNTYLMARECNSNSFGDKENKGDFIEEVSDDIVLSKKSIFP